jgi:competence protein ComEC
VLGFCVAESLSVRVIDVGHGDAILIQLADLDILVDAGPPTSHGRARLDRALATISGPLEMLVITHPHNDHVGGAAHVLETVVVDEVVTNGEAREINAYVQLEAAMADLGISPSRYTPGDTLEPYPGLVLEFLATGGLFPDSERGRDINNDSVVMTISWAGRRVMLTGDVEEAAGDRLVAEHCPPAPWTECPALASDLLKVPHHGSSHQSLEFLRAVHPGYAVISAGFEDRRYHLPRLSIVGYLRDVLGARVDSTSVSGAQDILLTIDSEGLIGGIEEGAAVFGWAREEGRWVGRVESGVARDGV